MKKLSVEMIANMYVEFGCQIQPINWIKRPVFESCGEQYFGSENPDFITEMWLPIK